MVKFENRLSLVLSCSMTFSRFSACVEELFMSDSSVFYDSNSVLLSDYDTLMGYFGSSNEEPKRKVLEEKLGRGEILFPNNKLKVECNSHYVT